MRMIVRSETGEEVPVSEETRFSKYATPGSPRFLILLEWERRFIQAGIAAVIVKTRNGYAVFRNGLINDERQQAA